MGRAGEGGDGHQQVSRLIPPSRPPMNSTRNQEVIPYPLTPPRLNSHYADAPTHPSTRPGLAPAAPACVEQKKNITNKLFVDRSIDTVALSYRVFYYLEVLSSKYVLFLLRLDLLFLLLFLLFRTWATRRGVLVASLRASLLRLNAQKQITKRKNEFVVRRASGE